MGKSLKFPKSGALEYQNLKLAVCLQNIENSKLNVQIPLDELKLNQISYYYLQNSAFEADFLWKVSLKILSSGIILKTFTHVGLNATKPVLGVCEQQRRRPTNCSAPLLYTF